MLLDGGESCVVCGCRTNFYPICRKCCKSFFSVKASFSTKKCNICGKKLISTNDICSQCKEKKVLVHTDSMWPLFSYKLWNKDLMFLWKTEGVRTLSDIFASFFAEALWLKNMEYIVPVPPRPGKIKQKGWDQIDEISKILKYKYGFKILPVLERKTKMQQKKLDRKKRLETIGNTYFLVQIDKIEAILKPYGNKIPKRVCIIDDVCTTGATIENCAAVLKKAGAEKVEAISLFMVD